MSSGNLPGALRRTAPQPAADDASAARRSSRRPAPTGARRRPERHDVTTASAFDWEQWVTFASAGETCTGQVIGHDIIIDAYHVVFVQGSATCNSWIDRVDLEISNTLHPANSALDAPTPRPPCANAASELGTGLGATTTPLNSDTDSTMAPHEGTASPDLRPGDAVSVVVNGVSVTGTVLSHTMELNEYLVQYRWPATGRMYGEPFAPDCLRKSEPTACTLEESSAHVASPTPALHRKMPGKTKAAQDAHPANNTVGIGAPQKKQRRTPAGAKTRPSAQDTWPEAPPEPTRHVHRHAGDRVLITIDAESISAQVLQGEAEGCWVQYDTTGTTHRLWATRQQLSDAPQSAPPAPAAMSIRDAQRIRVTERPFALHIGSHGSHEYAKITVYSVRAEPALIDNAVAQSDWKTLAGFNGLWNRGTSDEYVNAACTNNATLRGIFMNHGAGGDNTAGKLNGCLVISDHGIPNAVQHLFDHIADASPDTFDTRYNVVVARAYGNTERSRSMPPHNDGLHYDDGSAITVASPGAVAFSMEMWTTPWETKNEGPKVWVDFPTAPGWLHVCIIEGVASMGVRHSVNVPKGSIPRTAFVFRTMRDTQEKLITPMAQGTGIQRAAHASRTALQHVWEACRLDVLEGTLGASQSRLEVMLRKPAPVWGQLQPLPPSHWMSQLYYGNYFLLGTGGARSEISCHNDVLVHTNMHRRSAISPALGVAIHPTFGAAVTSVYLDFTTFTGTPAIQPRTIRGTGPYANQLELDLEGDVQTIHVCAPSVEDAARQAAEAAQTNRRHALPVRVLVHHAPSRLLPFVDPVVRMHPKSLESPHSTQAHYAGLGWVTSVDISEPQNGFWLTMQQ